MLSNFYKIAVRNLLKYKFYSSINILGLSIGIASFLFIWLYVKNELSYDQYHEHADRIVRLDFHAQLGDNEAIAAANSAPAGPTFKEEYPEVESFFRFRNRGNYLVQYENNNYKEENIVFADSTFFDFFSIDLLHGNAKTALTLPNSIIITKPMAKKYFGEIDPMGKSLKLDNEELFKVTGVMEKVPSNTHFQLDFLLSMSSIEESNNTNWGSINFTTYLLLRDGADLTMLHSKAQETLKKYFEPVLKEYIGTTWDDFMGAGSNYAKMEIMPLTDIHLRSDKTDEMAANSDIRYVYVFGIIGLFILLIGGINFVNLSTARSINRAKEVGVRKVVGAMRNHLIGQFLSESTVIAGISLLIAYGLMIFFLPYFNELAGKQLETSNLYAPSFIALAVGLTLATGLLSGLYPAFFLSGFNPIKVFKGIGTGKRNKSFFRNALVVFQFMITTILIICTTIIFRQLQYMQNKKLGYNKEQVLILNDAYALGNNVQAFKQKMLANPAVLSASVSGFLPVPSNRNTNSYFNGQTVSQENTILICNWDVDFDYVKTMGMEIVNGRDFNAELRTDSMSVIINEELARQLGHEDPIGEIISGFSSMENNELAPYKIIGVIKNFHFESLRNTIEPLALFINKSEGALSMRLQTDDIGGFIHDMESSFQELAPSQPFSYQFMDDRFSRMFETEQQLGQIASVFAFIAIFIACIGLLGLATFIAQQRTKEIGIRKVLGASIPNLVYLLCKDFGLLILIAFLIATPLSWYFMNQWLSDFAYATSVGIGVFLFAGALILLMAFLSVVYQAGRVATVNPVETLNYE